jgi:hypothetical protein
MAEALPLGAQRNVPRVVVMIVRIEVSNVSIDTLDLVLVTVPRDDDSLNLFVAPHKLAGHLLVEPLR